MGCTPVIEDKPLAVLGVGVQSLQKTDSKSVAGRGS